ncbi:MAG: omptin family outer membrane protease [Treponema sp.]|jgi:outer membrane protease|nr:omptin family outer membrane protease [Treponema sp.]
MKNIPVLMFLVIILFILTVKYPVFTQENFKNNDERAVVSSETETGQTDRKPRNFHISIGPLYGIMYGQGLEIVYPTDTAGKLLSELRWDMKPINYSGLQAGFEQLNSLNKWGLFTEISFLLGIPGDTGTMVDKDWRSVENGELTNYSRHKNRTNEFYWIDVKAGLLFPLNSRFYINPFLCGSWMMFSFTARDGEIKYARVKNSLQPAFYPIDDDPNIDTITGNVVNYTQNWLIAATGFIVGAHITPRFNMGFSFQITPLTFCSSVDEHIGSRTFYDLANYGLFIEPALNMSLNIKWIELNFNLGYRYINPARGKSYIEQSGNYSSSANDAGAGLSLFNACIIVKACF